MVSYRLGYIPSVWHNAWVVYIPKAANRSLIEAKSFRALSMSSFIPKGMEKAIVKYIEGTIMVERPLSSKQFAYRSGRSAETALVKLVNTIEKNF